MAHLSDSPHARGPCEAPYHLWLALHPALQQLCSGNGLPFQGPDVSIQFIKNLHLKYFSYNEKKRYDESLDDPASLELTLTTKIIISLSIAFLNISRFLITFIPLNQRRKIEEALKEVNLTIVEEKYFGKIYDPKWNKNNENNQMTEAAEPPNNVSKSYRSSSKSNAKP